MPEQHDKAYRLLFSFPQMVEELIHQLLGGDWTERLDFATLEKVSERSVGSKSLGGRTFRREKDLVWRSKYHAEPGWFYVYLHFEFQARPDPLMALRSMIYKGLTLEDFARRKELTQSGKLPPVLSIVVYTGGRPWTAATSLEDLVEPMLDGTPDGFDLLGYSLIDEARIRSGDLKDPESLIGCLSRLEQSHDLGALVDETKRLGRKLAGQEHKALREAFAVLINESIVPQLLPDQQLPPVHDLMEVPSMLAESALEWRQGWFSEGKEEGQRDLVGRQLVKRFGPLTPQVEKRLHAASSRELTVWGERLLDASSLEDVFNA